MSIIVKNNSTGEKKIILTVIILLFFSFAFLAYSERKQTDPAGKNSWWEIYFENPKSQDPTFTIKNYGKDEKFHWKELEADSTTALQESDIFIQAGQESTIPLFAIGEKKIILEVTDENGEKKEIYKSLD
jgi:hypothetical protein